MPDNLAHVDAQLNKLYQRFLKTLPPIAKPVLVKSQRAWIRYRDAEAKVHPGKLERTDCLISLTLVRAELLEELDGIYTEKDYTTRRISPRDYDHWDSEVKKLYAKTRPHSRAQVASQRAWQDWADKEQNLGVLLDNVHQRRDFGGQIFSAVYSDRVEKLKKWNKHAS